MSEPHSKSPRPQASRSGAANLARARELAVRIARALDGAKCEDIVVLDVSPLSQIADFLVLASGSSERQLNTAATKAEEAAEELGERVFGGRFDRSQTWIAIDFIDVVTHLFEPSARAHYDLELLWGEADRVEWRDGARKRGGAANPER